MSIKGMKSSVVNESFDSHYEKCFLAQEDEKFLMYSSSYKYPMALMRKAFDFYFS